MDNWTSRCAMVFAVWSVSWLACVAFLLTSCESRDEEERDDRVALWETVSSSNIGPGPYTRITKDAILLPDGTKVVCVEASSGLWCKEVKSPATRILEAKAKVNAPRPVGLPLREYYLLDDLSFGQ